MSFVTPSMILMCDQDSSEARLYLYLAGFADGKRGTPPTQTDSLYLAGHVYATEDAMAQAELRAAEMKRCKNKLLNKIG
ncbi:hypothetical protein [Leptolyngbya sp. FACHB-261]|uniref:hypothetical protein n=1 Tax=Leptolyngbya sp. FACHB-261 TaxID=2692806 RepID=UPI001683738D|nr:hypothetical protein [Leptolyngbya sp. FACHB-261]MBD2101636.1 hypothetical protein [Leptolyngbya sp. FACHB-261]